MTGDFKIKNAKFVLLTILHIKNWPTYFLDLFNLIKKKHVTYKFRNGLKYSARANCTDRGIITTVAVQDEYGIKKLDLLNSTIIDIGGQNGYFSIYASKYAKNIFIYEPVQENYQMILKNIQINGLGKKIHPFNLAVSNKKEKLKIFLSSENTGGHSVYGSGKNYQEVKTTTLPDIFKDNFIEVCDLLKMDNEGSEYRIFYNLPDEYFKKIINIRMEVHNIDKDRNNSDYFIKFLKNKGYRITFKDSILFARKINR